MLAKDELRSLIHEVISERDAERLAHPEKRERLTTFVGADGETVHSVSQTRRDWLKTIASVVMATSVIVGAFNVVVVYPIMDSRAQAAIKVHTEEANKKMDEMSKQIVFRSEWDKWTAEKDERWRNLDVTLTEIKASLAKVQENQMRILEKMR